ncbi:MAG: mechanosensitive ion channel [Bacteroidales bacterium]|nr:mechanosensitive ion channel [Bacteroidales bacterium]
MIKKIFTALLLLFALQLPSFAVVKEKNMDLTVKELHDDLQTYKSNLEYNISRYEAQRAEYWSQMNKCMHECQEYSIVLYTQQGNRLFGLSQACQNLEDLMESFRKNQHPFEKWKTNFDTEIERYGRLEELLGRIDTRSLTTRGEQARQQCVVICGEIKERLDELQKQIYANDELYEAASSRMEDMAQYNANRFESIRHNVFMSGGESYFSVLGHIGQYFTKIKADFAEDNSGMFTNKTAVRENLIMMATLGGVLAFCIIVAILLTTVLLPARFSTEEILKKRRLIAWAIALTLFVLLSLFVCHTFLSGFIILPSVDLLLYGLVIVAVFVISAALRFKADQAHSIMRCYLPIFITAFVFVLERLMLVSNNVINLTIPLLLLVSFIWQLCSLVRHKHFEERFSAITLWLTCVITGMMWLLSWAGYTFMALMLIIFWIVLLSCLQAVTCINFLIKHAAGKQSHKDARKLWLNPTMEKLILPILSIASFAASFIWAAKMFSMRSWAEGVLKNNLAAFFAGPETKLSITLSGLLLLVGLAFVIVWVIYMVKTALKEVYKENYTTGAIPLYVTLGSIFVWFLYAVVCIKTIGIDNEGLIAAMGGLGVGFGFALKDTINDLFCGLSLLMGRVHLNDYIECDGIRGRIVEVGMRATTIDTMDGSLMSFLNSQLFSKNFRNLTKSHNWELAKIPVGVSYGTDVEKARDVILSALLPLQERMSYKAPAVQIADFGESSVDLVVKVWVRSSERLAIVPEIREIIYKAFAGNGIEIPFPQRDIHIKND